MDASIIASIVSVSAGTITAGGAVITTIVSRKDSRQRKADAKETSATADKLHAEKREIYERASATALQSVQSELSRVKVELEKAYLKADELREVLQEKNDQIDLQDRIIRRLNRRSEVLEDWIESNQERFRSLGIEGLPVDVLDDRRHRDDLDRLRNLDEDPEEVQPELGRHRFRRLE